MRLPTKSIHSCKDKIRVIKLAIWKLFLPQITYIQTNTTILNFRHIKVISVTYWPIRHLSKRGLWSNKTAAAAAAKSLQLCPTLGDPIDGSPPGSPVPGILQARTLEWVAISFSNAGKWKVKVKSLSRVRLFATPWTAAYQAPLSMGFSRQEYWSGLPLPSANKTEKYWKIKSALKKPQY